MNALTLLFTLALAGLPPSARRAHPSSPAPAAAPDASPALSDAEVAERAVAYLGAIDRPVSAETWRALGPRAVAPLEAIARDPQALPTRRARALTALSTLGGDRARQVVLDAVRAGQGPYAVRASALRAAGRLLDAKALAAELRPVMEGRDEAALRATAAEVLARHAGASGCTAVKSQALREHGAARLGFERALERCSGSLAP
jgi:hypothetical protein